jgi:KaiC/GvpD/RAD55 family RecA-like ATPase
MRRPDAAAVVLYGGCGCGYATGVEGSAGTAGGVHGFPAALTSFIGRGGPLREVAGLLGRHRLVTVTGPGGAGKTRLAVQVARAVAREFADGAWMRVRCFR